MVKAKVLSASLAHNVTIRLDLPAGLTAYSKSSTSPVIASTGSGSSVYWQGLTLAAHKRKRVFKIRARSCASTEPVTYALTGAVYMNNGSNAVTCVSPAAAPVPVREVVLY